jgi:hypothetical protein
MSPPIPQWSLNLALALYRAKLPPSTGLDTVNLCRNQWRHDSASSLLATCRMWIPALIAFGIAYCVCR